MALGTIEENQVVINDYFSGDKAPRGSVNESTLRQTILSIITRADTAYVDLLLAYDAGVIENDIPAVSTITVVAHVPAVAEVPESTPGAGNGTPGIGAIPGTIVITDYNPEAIYTVTTTTVGDVTQLENQIIEGGFDKMDVHYQNGTITISGKITDDIVERPFTVQAENAYYDCTEAPMLLSVALPVPTP